MQTTQRTPRPLGPCCNCCRGREIFREFHGHSISLIVPQMQDVEYAIAMMRCTSRKPRLTKHIIIYIHTYCIYTYRMNAHIQAHTNAYIQNAYIHIYLRRYYTYIPTKVNMYTQTYMHNGMVFKVMVRLSLLQNTVWCPKFFST